MTTAHSVPHPAKTLRWRLWLARAAWLFSLSLVLLVMLGTAPTFIAVLRREWILTEAAPALRSVMPYTSFVWLVAILGWLVACLYALVACLLTLRRPGNTIAISVAAILLVMTLPMSVGHNLDNWRLPAWLPGIPVQPASFFVAFFSTAVVSLYLLLPDGRTVPPKAMGRLGLFIAALVAVQFFPYDRISPAAERWAEDILWFVTSVGFVLLQVMILGYHLHRLRQETDPLGQQQSRWILAGLSLPAAWWLFSLGRIFFLNDAPVLFVMEAIGGTLVWAAIPISIAVALLRHRLWDVDRVAGRTLIYAASMIMVGLLFLASLSALSLLVRNEDAPWVTAVAVGIAAFAVQPLYRSAQKWVNRLLYGHREDPVTVVERLGEQVQNALAPDALLPTLVASVGQLLRLPYVAITGAGGEVLAAAGRPKEPQERFPLTFQSAQVGELRVSRRAADEAFSPADRRLLATIANQAAPALHAAQLTAELQRSRRAIVTAREEERRRLRRDLHDGLGPQLASQTLTIDAIIRKLEKDPPGARALLGDLKQQAQDSIRDIRRLVYELRPPALDDLGLVEVIRESARRQSEAGIAIRVEAAELLERLPAAVEVAALRIVQEALTNIVNHSGAANATVRMALVAGHLDLVVEDDGRGLPAAYQAGVGHQSMRERAAEVGGTWQVGNKPEGGVRVSASLPLHLEGIPHE
jgi:signal transduction histidine kinase